MDEIDEPGEWAIDFKDKKIYFYPKAEKDLSNVILSDNKTSLVKLDGVSNITFSGIEFNGNLGYGIEIVNGSKNITLEGCKIHNISSTGIHIEKSSEVRIQSNDIFNIGSFAIYAKQCGNLYTLTDANIIIDNNHIYNMGLLAFNGGIGLLECAGFTISHNLIHDTPKSCIENRNGIKILIEYNEMHNIALKSGDTGAVYSYGGWCDKDWNEVLRDGTDRERFPESFPSLDEACNEAWSKVVKVLPHVTHKGFGQWITKQSFLPLSQTEELNWGRC